MPQITTGVDETTQESDYPNGTLQQVGSAERLTMTIHTYLEVPDEVASDEETLADFLQSALADAEAAVPGLAFAVEVGLSFNEEQPLEDEDTDDENGDN
jgi:hypothetical protein